MPEFESDQLLAFRTEELNHIRHLDNLHWKSLTAIATLSLGAIVGVRTLDDGRGIIWLLVLVLVSLNLIGIAMLFRTRRRYLEKTDIVRVLENLLPDIIRRELPKEWKKSTKVFPFTSYFAFMIYFHFILVTVLLIWGYISEPFDHIYLKNIFFPKIWFYSGFAIFCIIFISYLAYSLRAWNNQQHWHN